MLTIEDRIVDVVRRATDEAVTTSYISERIARSNLDTARGITGLVRAGRLSVKKAIVRGRVYDAFSLIENPCSITSWESKHGLSDHHLSALQHLRDPNASARDVRHDEAVTSQQITDVISVVRLLRLRVVDLEHRVSELEMMLPKKREEWFVELGEGPYPIRILSINDELIEDEISSAPF